LVVIAQNFLYFLFSMLCLLHLPIYFFPDLALAASSIRIEAPVPGKSMVGIEVPNATFGLVNLRSVIESNSFQKAFVKSKLTLALGKGAGGEAISADLSKMPGSDANHRFYRR
jgi:hypothetical protein